MTTSNIGFNVITRNTELVIMFELADKNSVHIWE